MNIWQEIEKCKRLKYKGEDNLYSLIEDDKRIKRKLDPEEGGIEQFFNTIPKELHYFKSLYEAAGGFSTNFLIGGEYWTRKYWFKMTLQLLENPGWYLGTSYPRMIRNREVYFRGIMLFHFTQDSEILTIYHFEGRKENNTNDRLKFCDTVISYLQSDNTEAEPLPGDPFYPF